MILCGGIAAWSPSRRRFRRAGCPRGRPRGPEGGFGFRRYWPGVRFAWFSGGEGVFRALFDGRGGPADRAGVRSSRYVNAIRRQKAPKRNIGAVCRSRCHSVWPISASRGPRGSGGGVRAAPRPPLQPTGTPQTGANRTSRLQNLFWNRALRRSGASGGVAGRVSRPHPHLTRSIQPGHRVAGVRCAGPAATLGAEDREPRGRAALPDCEGPGGRQVGPGNRPTCSVAAHYGDHPHASHPTALPKGPLTFVVAAINGDHAHTRRPTALPVGPPTSLRLRLLPCAPADRRPAGAGERGTSRAAFPDCEGPAARQAAPGNRPACSVAAPRGDHVRAWWSTALRVGPSPFVVAASPPHTPSARRSAGPGSGGPAGPPLAPGYGGTDTQDVAKALAPWPRPGKAVRVPTGTHGHPGTRTARFTPRPAGPTRSRRG